MGAVRLHIAGKFDITTARREEIAQASHFDTAIAGRGGVATTGDYGFASVGQDGIAQAGHLGIIQFRYLDKETKRFRLKIGYIGEEGLKPNTFYQLNEKFEIESVQVSVMQESRSNPFEHASKETPIAKAQRLISRCYEGVAEWINSRQ